MKISVISEAGYSCDLFWRAQMQGHQVRVWIKEEKYKHVYDDLIPKVTNWQSSVSWADVIVFDHTGMSDIWKKVKDVKPCFGGSEWADKLEKDRPYAKGLFKQIGLKAFESLRAKDFKEAIGHVQKHKVKHVVKPVGKDVDSHHVIISEDSSGQDAAALLQTFESQGLKADYLEIEERKEGIEVGVSGWFNGTDWTGDININFEHKRLATGLPEGVGPLTGEMGTGARYDSRENPLFNRTLDLMRPILRKENYRGQLDISFIIDQSGSAWPLEATPRLGYPACMIEEPTHISPMVELFAGCAKGDTNFVNQTTRDWSVGVVCIMPGFPSVEEAAKRSLGIPIFGLSPKYAKQVHLVEAKAGKVLEGVKARVVTSEGMGYPMVITGTGKTLEQAKTSAYGVIKATNPDRVRIPNMIYRTDIGDRVMRQEKDFERLGILTAEETSDMESLVQ